MREGQVLAAQAFADIATIAILQQRAARDAQRLSEQLSTALNSRIVVEQCKGMLAERAGIELDRAFATLRAFARNHNLLLADVARSFISGDVTTAELGLPSAADSG
jgi:AmiR/NasT family two-component response regulator